MKTRAIVSSKKGNLNVIVPAVLTLILAAALLVMGLIVTEKLRDTAYSSATATISNEAGGINSTGFTLQQVANYRDFSDPTIVQITNASGIGVITSGNYTITGNIITNTTATTFNHVLINYTASYNSDTEASLAGNKTVTGLGSFADFWEIIVLAIVITIVISLLLVVFAVRGRAR